MYRIFCLKAELILKVVLIGYFVPKIFIIFIDSAMR